MRAPRRWNIQATASSIGAIALVIAGLIIGVVNERTFQAGKTQSLNAQAEVLASTVDPALVFQDPAAAQELVSALRSDPQIQIAAVYDEAGRRLALLAKDGAAAPERADRARAGRGGGATSVTTPVVHEGRRIGLVYLKTAKEPVRVFMQRHAGTALLLLTAMLVLAAAQAAQAAQARAAKDLAARAAELDDLNRRLQQQIERREVAEEALRQSQKMETLGQLTGGIAHDFNNLLQTIKGSLDLISRNPGNEAKVARWSGMAAEAADRGARVTAQLLAFSRAQKLEIRPVNVGEVIERLRALLPNALGAGVRVEFDIADGEAMVMADATQIELAVLNLCINARDAMPNGGDVTVATASEHVEGDSELVSGDYLLLSVKDTGVGMPADVRRHAFEPFYTTKGIGKGTGLGLAQVYGIARQAGGVARIESASGQGAKVTIYMPVAEGALGSPAPAEPKPATMPVKGASVLVVDDDQGVRTYVCEALNSLGYECVEASDGMEALKVLADRHVDLVILDYAMPGLTGAEVATRALKRQPDLPIIFASGYAESSALEAALGHPAEMLRKPFDTDVLASRVAEALEARP
jgi:signal transduction histidine kinase